MAKIVRRSEHDRRIKMALDNLEEAATLRAEAANRDDFNSRSLLAEAETCENTANMMLALEDEGEELVGGEIAVREEGDCEVALSHQIELKNQPMVEARASRERLTLAEKADVMIMAADAASSIEEPNSLEKMLAHQMAAAHSMAMNLFAQASQKIESINSQIDINHTSLLIGQANRLMKTYQSGLQTLLKAKKGGRQEVVVQHINVEKDAQAVVAGKMDYQPKNRGAVSSRRRDGRE